MAVQTVCTADPAVFPSPASFPSPARHAPDGARRASPPRPAHEAGATTPARQSTDTVRDALRAATLRLFEDLRACDPPGGARWREIREELITDHMSYARSLTRHFNASAESAEDLFQVACLALVKAVDGFDPGYGATFVSYLTPTVIGELKRHFRDTSWAVHVPRRMQELRTELRLATDEMGHALNRAPTLDELAARLGLSDRDIARASAAGDAYNSLSLDWTSFEGGAAESLDKLLGAVDPALDGVVDRMLLKPLIAALGERDRHILAMRYSRNLTQAEIGRRLGVSQMQVSRLLTRILAELREGIEGGEEPGVGHHARQGAHGRRGVSGSSHTGTDRAARTGPARTAPTLVGAR
jgi:RNA polymerase sigma-B factor